MIVMVGVDEQRYSAAALRRAIGLARALGADLHVVHAVHLPATVIAALGQTPLDVQSFEDDSALATWEQVDDVLATDGAEGMTVVRANVRGYPPDALLDYAEEHQPEMIVLGSRGRSELAAFFLGSTGHRVLHFAPCDVLIVKEESDASH